MKTLKLKKKSWHYYLAAELGPWRSWYCADNICAYTRAVILGFVLGVILLIVAGVVVFCSASALWWLVTSREHIHGYQAIGFVMIAIASYVGIWALVKDRVHEWQRKRRDERYQRDMEAVTTGRYYKQPSFIVLAWRHWREKTCVRINLE